MPRAAVARVLLDSPLPQLDHLFDYAIPEQMVEQMTVGVRVRVPLRSAGRIADGLVVELVDAVDHPRALSEIEELVSPVPVLTPEVWRLARRVADRAAGGASDVLRLAIPPRQVRVEKSYLASRRSENEADLAQEAAACVAEEGETSAPCSRTPNDLAVDGYREADLVGAVERSERLAVTAIARPFPLSDGTSIGTWASTLAQLARVALARGTDAIIAVPDYRDQEQLVAALDELGVSESVVRLDARQPNPERYRAFLRCLGAGPRVVVGSRSVLYAPSSSLGLIALFDDGDSSHAEPLAPYVHARDVALVRQEQSGAALVFLGHTRTVEVERLVELGFLTSVEPRAAQHPKVIPTAQQFGGDEGGSSARIPSTAWREAREALERGPVLVQVARPGYAPAVACARCRTVARCTRCQGPLAVRSAGSRPGCGWCGLIATEWSCSVCNATALRMITLGAGRTAEELGRAFPGTKVLVSDGARPLLTVDPTPALVVATRGVEPRASGGYAAVLLLDGERMLARESLRVAEDALRTWSNAAALAAAGAPVMLVGVSGRIATALATWRHADFARGELADRRALRFPPAVRLASVSGAPVAVAEALATLDDVGQHDVLGPVGIEDGKVRAIVRFEYARGAEIAERLRAAVVTNAARRRKPPTGKGNYRPAPSLRVRFDDPEIL